MVQVSVTKTATQSVITTDKKKTRKDRKVKSERPKILYIDTHYLLAVVIDNIQLADIKSSEINMERKYPFLYGNCVIENTSLWQ